MQNGRFSHDAAHLYFKANNIYVGPTSKKFAILCVLTRVGLVVDGDLYHVSLAKY